MTALQELLAKVEAGEWDTVRVFSAFNGKHLTIVSQAYNGSLDAAKALHEAVLPDAGYQLAFYDGSFDVAVSEGGMVYSVCITGEPARSWLICILKALIAQEATA